MENQLGIYKEKQRLSLREVFDKKTIILLGFAALILLLYFIIEDISINETITIFQNANLVLLILGAFFTFIAVLLDTLTWKLLLGISSIYPSTKTTYRIQLSSFAYGLLIPSAGAVEAIMRVILGTQEFMNEEENRDASSGEVLSSVIAHKLCGLLAFIPVSVFIAVSMFDYLSDIMVKLGYSPLPSDFNLIFIVLITLLAIIVVGLFILIAITPKKAKSIIGFILNGIGVIPILKTRSTSIRESSNKIINDFSIQFSYLAKNKLISFFAVILAFFAQIAHWISILFVLHSIDILISLDQVAAVNFLGGTVDLIPVGIPGMAGLKEISLSVFIEYGLNIEKSLALSGAILVQLVKFYFLIIIGMIAYLLGKTYTTKVDVSNNPPLN